MHPIKIAIAAGIGFLVTGTYLGQKKNHPVAPSPANAAPVKAAPIKPTPELRLIGFKCTNEYGFTTVQGTVQNITDKPIQQLMVVAQHFTGSYDFIRADTGMVEYQPLMPGQVSPFRAMGSYNPMMQRCGVDFKRMFGGQVETER